MATPSRGAQSEERWLVPAELLDLATPDELDDYYRCLSLIWEPQDYQRPPSLTDPSWDVWALIGGRGIGKSGAGAWWLDEVLRSAPGLRARIIAPTLDDAKKACVEGESGLLARNPSLRVNYNDHDITWTNGSMASWFGADKPDSEERFRAAGNVHIDWFEEMGAMRFAIPVWKQAELGRRLTHPAVGKPRVIVTTTPRSTPIIRWLMRRPVSQELGLGPMQTVVFGRTADGRTPTTDDNLYLHPDVRAKYRAQYEGTRLGRQELLGELLEDVPGALWTLERIDTLRVAEPPDMVRIVIGVDPSGSSKESANEQGIVVCGLGADGHGYTLADYSGHFTPDGWGREVVRAFREWGADRVVAERNYGGELVLHVIERAAQEAGISIPVDLVVATRGKAVRAEPVSQLAEQGRDHHVGTFDKLEDQMTSWVPGNVSPDRLDAKVWAMTELMPAMATAQFVTLGAESRARAEAARSLAGPGDAELARRNFGPFVYDPRFG